jgi:hypothetical protein
MVCFGILRLPVCKNCGARLFSKGFFFFFLLGGWWKVAFNGCFAIKVPESDGNISGHILGFYGFLSI